MKSITRVQMPVYKWRWGDWICSPSDVHIFWTWNCQCTCGVCLCLLAVFTCSSCFLVLRKAVLQHTARL